MTDAPATADDIIEYLKRGAYEDSITTYIAPWELVESMESDKLVKWYEQAKASEVLATLETTDPALYAELKTAKTQSDALSEKYREISARCGADMGAFFTQWDEYRDTHPQESEIAYKYNEFANSEAVEKAIFSFRPDDFPPNRTALSDTGRSLLTYALFHNQDTGEYLVTMRDKRPDGARPESFSMRDAIVDHQMIDGAGRTQEEVLEEAKTLWADHLTSLMRYAPITSRTHVAAMEEADRLRAHFKAAAAGDDASPARPKRGLFEFFPAFRRAYGGEDGFYQALDDVFGENGNQKYLLDIGNGGWTHTPMGGEEEDAKYGVVGYHFTDLYEKMNTQDRDDFYTAFDRFVDHLPELNYKDKDFAYSVAQDLAHILIAVEHGTGAFEAANYMPDLYIASQNILHHIRKDEEDRADQITVDTFTDGPQW